MDSRHWRQLELLGVWISFYVRRYAAMPMNHRRMPEHERKRFSKLGFAFLKNCLHHFARYKFSYLFAKDKKDTGSWAFAESSS